MGEPFDFRDLVWSRLQCAVAKIALLHSTGSYVGNDKRECGLPALNTDKLGCSWTNADLTKREKNNDTAHRTADPTGRRMGVMGVMDYDRA